MTGWGVVSGGMEGRLETYVEAERGLERGGVVETVLREDGLRGGEAAVGVGRMLRGGDAAVG